VRPSLALLRSSTFRLLAIYLALFAVSVSAVLGYVYWNTAKLLDSQIDTAIAADVRSLVDVYRNGGFEGLLNDVARRSEGETESLYIFTSPMGRRLAGNLPGLPVEAAGKPGPIVFGYALQGEGALQRREAKGYAFELDGGYKLVVGRDVEERRRFDRIVRTSTIWGLGLALALGLAGGILMSRDFLSRVETINAAARSIMKGDLSLRMPVSGTGDELDRLSGNLNDMLAQIERLMAGMREVSSNVAHDLKTPLTRIRACAEDALRSRSPAARKAALERIIADTDRLLATFNALLSIARAEAGHAREGIAPVEVNALVADIAELYEPTVEEAGGTLETALASGASTVLADRQLLAQVLTNLLDNALKYGADEQTGKASITLAVTRQPAAVTISVADRGPGIPQDQRERVKERFVRLDESRSQPGSGLGLALAASVAHLHNGELHLDDNHPGLAVRLILPAADTVSKAAA
jgi:signal transduction histidine kinase